MVDGWMEKTNKDRKKKEDQGSERTKDVSRNG
jgi:hypothetical protein